MNILKPLFSTIVLLFLSGCAMTNTDFPLRYYPDKKITSFNNKNMIVNEFADERGEDPKMIMHKINLKNVETQGMLLAEKPIAKIISDSLEKSLGSSKGDYVITGSLKELNIKTLEGLVRSNLHTKITVAVQLREKKTNRILFDKAIIGRSNIQSNVIYTSSDDWLRKGFKLAVDDLLKQILSYLSVI